MSTPAPLDQAGNVRDENNFDPALILPFLQSQIADLKSGTLELKQFPGGASNLTYQLTVGGREMILRRPPSGTKPKSGHDMGREFRVLSALYPHFPCPRPLAYCQDESLIGAPFYVMEKLGGVILRRDLPKGMSYTPEQAHTLCTNLFDTQIRLHTLDYKAIGLGDLGHPEGYVARQIKGWNERYAKVITDDVPSCESVMKWLVDKQPADSPTPALIHNDYKLDNVVLSPVDQLSVIGVLDWEMCTLGDPLMDLGSTIAYWVEAGDSPKMQVMRMQPSNLPGMMTRAEVMRYYSERTGVEIRNPDYYYVFGLFRLAVIAQQIYYRWKIGQSKNPKYQQFGMLVAILAEISDQVIQKSKG
jgi:aminoglycoside phosphotransferase (APT) family kinase protein